MGTDHKYTTGDTNIVDGNPKRVYGDDVRVWDDALVPVSGHVGDRWEERTGRSRHELVDVWRSAIPCECPHSSYDHARLVDDEGVVLLAHHDPDDGRYVATVKHVDHRAEKYD